MTYISPDLKSAISDLNALFNETTEVAVTTGHDIGTIAARIVREASALPVWNAPITERQYLGLRSSVADLATRLNADDGRPIIVESAIRRLAAILAEARLCLELGKTRGVYGPESDLDDVIKVDRPANS